MPSRRDDLWQALDADGAFDVVVVGGGVNGVGVFRDLSLQGRRVLLVDRSDFASGCSAAPSRMIHGGLRYLENGELDLVREAIREREALLRNAPHMVRPLPTMIPIPAVLSGTFNSALGLLGRQGKPSARGALPIKAGLWLYDWFSRSSRMPRHTFVGKARTRARWPELNGNMRFCAIYHDAWISHPERLCIEMIRDTSTAFPASVALNYAKLRRTPEGFEVLDRRGGRRAEVRPRAVVHATGAWLNESVDALASPQNRRMVEGTKGSHLVIDNPDLLAALGGHMVYFGNGDRRVCIVFPYLGRVLAGSTDIRVKSTGRTRCEVEERDYILDSLALVFSGIKVTPEHVVFSYSGIRPLPQSDQDFTRRIPRSHFLRRIDGEIPQFCMIGGKWTTFRAFAEQTTDAVLAELGAARRRETLALPIGGGRDFPKAEGALESELIATFGVSARRAAHLANRYGTTAMEVETFYRDMGGDAILPGTCYSRNEITWMVRQEQVETLSDIVMRRSDLAIRGDLSLRLLTEIAELFRTERALSDDEIARGRSDRRGTGKMARRLAPDAGESQRNGRHGMRVSAKARMNRLFTNGGCLDVAIDHGVCNEPSFMVGLEDMAGVVDTLIGARPDAIQMAYGASDLLQSRPEKDQAGAGDADRHGEPLQRSAAPGDVVDAAEP